MQPDILYSVQCYRLIHKIRLSVPWKPPRKARAVTVFCAEINLAHFVRTGIQKILAWEPQFLHAKAEKLETEVFLHIYVSILFEHLLEFRNCSTCRVRYQLNGMFSDYNSEGRQRSFLQLLVLLSKISL